MKVKTSGERDGGPARPCRPAGRIHVHVRQQAGGRRVWDLTGYQWTVVFAAWLGWGFDVFDGLLFNFVAPNCVPTLLGLPIGTPEARSATLFWTGVLTSLLLIGWAIGGTIFGKVADRIGRTRTLLLTMLIYSVGTALCAFAPNIWMLAAFRFVASLGIGGEWAAGASMVAEVVPEKRRVEAGALLYTSAPFGLVLATLVNYVVAGRLFPRPSRGVVALRLPVRPDPGRGGAAGPALRQGAGALGVGQGPDAAAGRRAVHRGACARPPSAA